jgi:hypothetical protein
VSPSDWIAVIAALGAVAAGWYARTQARAARAQVDFAAQQLVIAEQIRRDQAQPYVFADLRPDERDPVRMVLVIENRGATIARNVRIAFDPPLRSKSYREVSSLRVLQDGIPALPPGRRISWDFESSLSVLDADLPRRYTVTVDADGPFGPVDQLVYDIDFGPLDGSDIRSSGQLRDIEQQLRQIRQAIGRLTTAVNQGGLPAVVSQSRDPASLPVSGREHEPNGSTA